MNTTKSKTTTTTSSKEFVDRLPVARFYYKGQSHTHPVRRTVVISEITKDHVTGYELREGNTVRSLDDAPVKTYIRKSIPVWNSDWRLRRAGERAGVNLDSSTFTRSPMSSLSKVV